MTRTLLLLLLGAAACAPGTFAEGLTTTELAAGSPSFLFILGDDIGWADFRYNNGTSYTPNVDAWVAKQGTLIMQDLHSGGTVCSPTRATILTGRNHFRDCVSYVYGCSDMTECVPQFNFAPEKTFTIAHAVRAANKNYASQIFGKVRLTNSPCAPRAAQPAPQPLAHPAAVADLPQWHLGSFYDDSEKYGGITSSPITHGFDHFNMTVEVAPTLSTNNQCNQVRFDFLFWSSWV